MDHDDNDAAGADPGDGNSDHLRKIQAQLLVDVEDRVGEALRVAPRSTGELVALLTDEFEAVVGSELLELLVATVLRRSNRVVFDTIEERWHDDDQLFAGVIFTRRITADELRRDVIDALDDLHYAMFGLHDVGGDDDLDGSTGADRIRQVFAGPELPQVALGGSFIGPPGWLAGVGAGDIVGLRRREDRVVLERIGRYADFGRETRLMRALVERICDRGVGVDPYDLVLAMLMADSEAFRSPIPPIEELLGDAGLAERDGFFGRAGEDFVAPGVRDERVLIDALSRRYQLDECCRDAFTRLTRRYTQIVQYALAAEVAEERGIDVDVSAIDDTFGFTLIDRRQLRDDLHHGAAVPALLDWERQRFERSGVDRLDAFAEFLVGDRGARGMGLYLRAVAGLRVGAGAAALVDVQQAFALDQHPAAGLLLADLVADSGDYVRALGLRRQVTDGSDAVASYYASLLRPFLGAGRNDSCPCGSGRKYKQCCLRRPALSLQLRVRLRWHRIVMFSRDPVNSAALLGPALDSLPDDPTPDDIAARRRDLFLNDVAILEGEIIYAYLDQRADLLPSDELAWVEAWGEAVRSLYEITDVDDGLITARDLMSGVDATATLTAFAQQVGFERAESRFSVGDYILAVVVEADGRHFVVGTVLSIGMTQRASVVELLSEGASAHEIAAWYGSTVAPPRVVNREMEELVVIEAIFAPPAGGWVGAERALDRAFDRDGPDDEPPSQDTSGAPARWFEEYQNDDGEWILRATLHRQDDRLVVTVNSLVRFDRVRTRLLDLGFELIDVTESHDRDDLLRRATTSESPPDDPTGGLPPEAIDQIREQMEDRWLAEHVPMFGGLTPVEAAADPTRRGDLVRFIDEMAAMPAIGIGAYDIGRLRHKLGLD